ncbi:FAD-dependent oxidoreductase [Nocardia sp. BSTN01]|uniref:NAD(P)/FAD-dependent oxidoreductase n=1 Tax=Nocardia sp. BSTN01 TaxID=2783665 RepID=UPI0018903EDA|nr:FAD/NAD(P)-binding oxidoreductase [Nocardia sp. BSTN01]MBF4997365.1 FAD-dependent oxidoreductase [Nocardia sp. BSTN01]
MSEKNPVVVVGAGLGGIRTAEALRSAGYTGRLVVVGAEPHLPYDRPPLSKEYLRGDRDNVSLCGDGVAEAHNLEFRTATQATGLDLAGRRLVLGDSDLGYDRLVVATGLVPRSLPGSEKFAGTHVLRTLDDAAALRAELGAGRRMVVVGAGFIGCEIAATAVGLGVEVTIVEPQPTPLCAALGQTVGALVGRLHLDAGVDLRCGVGVAGLDGGARVKTVRLNDGTEIEADLVVSAIGSVPAVAWLSGSGLELADGIVCDERGRTSDPHVWAVGDVAAWYDQAHGRAVRREHWTPVTEQAVIAAGDLLGQPPSSQRGLAYFWSDQHGVKLQALGDFRPDDDVRIVHDDGRRFMAVYARSGRISGVVGGGMPAKVIGARSLIERAAGIDEI